MKKNVVMKTPKTWLIGSLSLLIATAMALPVNAQQQQQQRGEQQQREQGEGPTREQVNSILEGWHEEAQEVARSFMERHGEPQEATLQRLIWHDGLWWKRTEIVNEEVPHNFPEEHTDFLYQTVNYNVPVEKVGELAQLSGSLIVDRVRGELTARSDSERHTLLLLNVADQVIDGRHTPDSGRDVIAQAWLEGEHAEMMERLLFSPEVAHPDPADPGVVYGARPEEEEETEQEEEEEDEEEEVHPLLRRR